MVVVMTVERGEKWLDGKQLNKEQVQGIKATNRDRVHAIWHRVVAHEGQHEPVCSEIRCCQSCFFLQLTHSSILKALPFFKPTSGQSPCPSAVRTLATAKENAPIVDDRARH